MQQHRRTAALSVGLLTLALLASAPTGAAGADSAATVESRTTLQQVADGLIGRTTADVEHLLAGDPSASIVGTRIRYADHFSAPAGSTPAPAKAVAPLARTFELHSRPGSPRTIYLDFDGERVCETAWNTGGGGLLGGLFGASNLPCGSYEGFRGRTGAGALSASDRTQIQEIWARVAEDFAPFDVNVTTERPPAGDLDRSGAGDKRYGVHGVITASDGARNGTCGGPGCAGVAFLGVFPDADSNKHRIFWTFANEVDNDPARVADVLSHEAGHTLGLEHDGGGNQGAYYSGHGIWGPIMGSGDSPLTQWSRGEYAGANQLQDDLAVIARHGASVRGDDHADKPGKGTRLRRGKPVAGVISTPRDVDAFRFRTTCRGPVTVRARNAGQGPNLDISLTVRRPGAKKARVVDPISGANGKATGLDATHRGNGRRGVWKVRIDGVGARDPLTTGYSDYGSLGAFTVKVTGKCVER